MVGRALSPTHHFQSRTSPTSSGTTIDIAARHRIEPLLQGSLDGLCGLYGAINALRLALADQSPLTKSDCRKLFADGVEFLHGKKGLSNAAVEGMGTHRRFALARHLARQISSPRRRVQIERVDHRALRTIEGVLDWIEVSLTQGMPVLLTLTGGLEHYTVVAGATSKTLRLFDSSGHRFIRKSSCSIRSGFYQIPPNGLLRVAVNRSG
jgi:hypothetical protein